MYNYFTFDHFGYFCGFCIWFFWYIQDDNENSYYDDEHYIDEFKPRKFRKWENYSKKEEWTERYMKYLLHCKEHSKKPYPIPWFRISGIDKNELNILYKFYQELNLKHKEL